MVGSGGSSSVVVVVVVGVVVVVVVLVLVAAAAVASAVARQRHGGGLVACATWLRPHEPLRRRAAKHRDKRTNRRFARSAVLAQRSSALSASFTNPCPSNVNRVSAHLARKVPQRCHRSL